MKTLWLVVSVLAIANMLAVAGFVGWLKMSDRLDGTRLTALRAMLSKTIAEQKAEEDALAATAAAEKSAALEAQKKGRPPMTAAEQLTARLEASEIDAQRMQAMVASIETLRAPLQVEREALAQKRLALEKDKVTFQAIADAANVRARDEQFKKTAKSVRALACAVLRSPVSSWPVLRWPVLLGWPVLSSS